MYSGAAMRRACNSVTMFISGGTSSGKTTFLNALLKEVPDTERIFSIEDTRELKPPQPNYLALLASKGDQGKSREGEPQQGLVGPVPRSGAFSGHREQFRARPRVLILSSSWPRSNARSRRTLPGTAGTRRRGKRCSRRFGMRSGLSRINKSSG